MNRRNFIRSIAIDGAAAIFVPKLIKPIWKRTSPPGIRGMLDGVDMSMFAGPLIDLNDLFTRLQQIKRRRNLSGHEDDKITILTDRKSIEFINTCFHLDSI